MIIPDIFQDPYLGEALWARIIVKFVPSNQWVSSSGQIEEYVLQDMYEWLSSPSRQK